MTANTLERLETEHRELYARFLPTLKEYQEMAARCLELQIGIFRARLQKTFDKAGAIYSNNLVASIPARETPAALDRLIAEIQKNKIEVCEIIYDPRTFTFHLFANDTKA